ncbi:TetR-like C-terminal domain-containing protein, partial [Streptomyces hirsutus]
GRARAQHRGELPPEPDPDEASRTVGLIFDMVAGAVVHRTLVSGQPVDEEWLHGFTRVLLSGLVTAGTGP